MDGWVVSVFDGVVEGCCSPWGFEVWVSAVLDEEVDDIDMAVFGGDDGEGSACAIAVVGVEAMFEKPLEGCGISFFACFDGVEVGDSHDCEGLVCLR